MATDGPVWAIVVAAGRGRRFGAPKQYEQVGGRRVLDWSLAAAAAASDGVVLVVTPDHADDEERADVIVAGGESRSASVRAGLAAVPASAGIVVVHDAVRPAAPIALFDAVVAAVREGADAAVPGLPVVDTLKRVEGPVVVSTIDRRGLVAVQTPQAFRAEVLRAVHAEDREATDDAALVEATGGRVVVVPGLPGNVKITHPVDMAQVFEVLR